MYNRSVIRSMWLSFADFKRRKKPRFMLPQIQVAIHRNGVWVTLDINQKAVKYQRRLVNYMLTRTAEFSGMLSFVPRIKDAKFYLPDWAEPIEMGAPTSEESVLKAAERIMPGREWASMGYTLPRSSAILYTSAFVGCAAKMIVGVYPFHNVCYSGPDKISDSSGMLRIHFPDEPPSDYQDPPQSQEYSVIRKIRDNEKSRALKLRYRYKCQVCRTSLGDGEDGYAEVHHLRPLGGRHRGLDNWNNMLVLCPNHHVQFDYGWAAVDPNSMKFLHVMENDEYCGTRLNFVEGHRLLAQNLKYHQRELYRGE